MSSSYKRDDKQFREHVARLADNGLNLHVGANCSIHRASPCNECSEAKAQFTPEFQLHLDRINNAKTHAEVEAAVNGAMEQIRTEWNAPKQTPKGKLPEFVVGLIAYAALGACVLFLIKWVILPLLGVL